jgi:hypothetical protein
MAGTVSENAGKLLEYLYSNRRDSYEGEILVEGTGLTADEVNDAVEWLAEQRLVKVMKALGTRPFEFLFIEMTARGRHAVEKAKQGPPPAPAPTQQTNFYVLTGSNNRVVQGNDSSHNVVKVNEVELFAQMRQAIVQAPADEAERRDVLDRLQELERTKGTPSFAAKLVAFMGAAHKSTETFGPLISPFLPALAQLAAG